MYVEEKTKYSYGTDRSFVVILSLWFKKKKKKQGNKYKTSLHHTANLSISPVFSVTCKPTVALAFIVIVLLKNAVMILVIVAKILARIVEINRLVVVIRWWRRDDEDVGELTSHADRLWGKHLILPTDDETVRVKQDHLCRVLLLAVVFRVRRHLVLRHVEGALARSIAS